MHQTSKAIIGAILVKHMMSPADFSTKSPFIGYHQHRTSKDACKEGNGEFHPDSKVPKDKPGARIGQ